ncbi:MAG: mevalonate kinase [Nitrosopumilus sp.]|nr:mevalonate kinase [Nitrosopumilus sp.]
MRSSASAPGKAVLLGEHFVMHGSGAVLCAINRRVTVTAEEAGGGMIRISSGVGSLEAPAGGDPRDVGPELRPLYHIALAAGTGVDITVDSEVPPGAGLGSSSACCVACAGAVLGLRGGASRGEALRLASEAERTAFPGASGADCAACARGGVILWDGRIRAVRPGPGLRVAVADSGQRHSTREAVGRVSKYRGADPAGFGRALEEVGRMVGEAPAQIEAGDEAGLGAAMSRNHALLREAGASTPGLERIISVAGGASAGAKLTGAGRGGCAIALDGTGRAAEAIRGAGFGCFESGMDNEGLIVFNGTGGRAGA